MAFVCDPTCCKADRWQRAVTLVDGPLPATEANYVSPCGEVVRLQWRTPMACPLCTPDHFEKVTGPCDVYGRQPVCIDRDSSCWLHYTLLKGWPSAHVQPREFVTYLVVV